LGLRARRVNLGLGRLEVVEVRYDAGRFGSGYKARPKSDTSIRPVPMAGLVVEAARRRLEGCPPDGLVFCGPGAVTGSGGAIARRCRSATTGAPTGWR
jgi:hypothetical protein